MGTTPFIQTMQFKTSEPDRVHTLLDDWEKRTEGKSTALRAILARDRSAKDRYVSIVFFDSYESAMENSALPETHELAEKIGALLDEPVTYTDLDVVEDRQ